MKLNLRLFLCMLESGGSCKLYAAEQYAIHVAAILVHTSCHIIFGGRAEVIHSAAARCQRLVVKHVWRDFIPERCASS